MNLYVNLREDKLYLKSISFPNSRHEFLFIWTTHVEAYHWGKGKCDIHMKFAHNVKGICLCKEKVMLQFEENLKQDEESGACLEMKPCTFILGVEKIPSSILCVREWQGLREV